MTQYFPNDPNGDSNSTWQETSNEPNGTRYAYNGGTQYEWQAGAPPTQAEAMYFDGMPPQQQQNNNAWVIVAIVVVGILLLGGIAAMAAGVFNSRSTGSGGENAAEAITTTTSSRYSYDDESDDQTSSRERTTERKSTSRSEPSTSSKDSEKAEFSGYQGIQNTSPQFAAAIYNAFVAKYAQTGSVNTTLEVYSPKTGLNYGVSCSGSTSRVVCQEIATPGNPSDSGIIIY